MTEIRASWVPDTLRFLDRSATEQKLSLPMTPSEYFATYCGVTPSSIHLSEVAMRHDIGVRQLMFGVDYPHHEGTWPNTAEWIQVAFAGVPEDEARLILGENAIRFYGLDRAPLAALAAKIGPRPEDVLVSSPAVAEPVVEHFHKRAGFARPADPVDEAELAPSFAADVAALTTAR